MTEALVPIVDRRSVHPTPYTPDRRETDSSAIIHLVTEIHRDVKEMDKKLTNHMESETSTLATEIAELMSKAFPEGDPDGHRKHHELVIKQAEARAAFWEKMRFEITRWGLIGFLGWAAIALWRSFLLGASK